MAKIPLAISMDVGALKKVERLRKGTGVTFTRFSKSEGRKVVAKRKPAMQKDFEKYAPKRPGQLYKRTFQLKRGWDISVRTPKTGFILRVTNKMPYAPDVVGTVDLRTKAGGGGQGFFFVGRWWIAGGKAIKHFHLIQNDYEKAMIDTLEDQTGFSVKRRGKLLK